MWWKSDEGRLKIYYTDADSSQWVDVFVLAGAGSAAGISFTPAGDIVATNVQDAIEELDSEKASIEVGTWTPTVAFSTNGNFSPSYDSQVGNYVKVGRLVTFWGRIQFDTNAYTTASGPFYVNGLPYTVYSGGPDSFEGASPYLSSGFVFDANTEYVTMFSDGGTTRCRFHQIRSIAGAASPLAVDTDNVPPSVNNILIFITGAYIAD